MTKPAAILDIDGTLVDTNYQHAIAWYNAFRQHDVRLPVWRIHRHIGMGGDQLVASLAGEDVERELGDDIRAAEKALYLSMIQTTQPLAGARELIGDLKAQGRAVVLASSAKAQEVEHYLDVLEAREAVDAWTTSDDVESTKPEPDLVRAALDKLGTDDAVMVGDTPWDVEAAGRAGVATIAVLTGGFSEQELREAGAAAVFDSIEALRDGVGDTPSGKRVPMQLEVPQPAAPPEVPQPVEPATPAVPNAPVQPVVPDAPVQPIDPTPPGEEPGRPAEPSPVPTEPDPGPAPTPEPAPEGE